MSTSALSDAALGYMDLGLPVIALTGKRPNPEVHPHWDQDCFKPDADPSAVWTAFTHRATTGVGIVIPDYYVVVDIDGEAGAKLWKEVVGDDFIPDRWVAKTGRGLHLWYNSFMDEPRRSVKVLENVNGQGGLDIKGSGGYVAAPPSRHPDGHTYIWLAEPSREYPPAQEPDGLVAWWARRAREEEAWRQERRTMVQRVGRPLRDGMLYAVATFDGIIRKMTEAPEGNRNKMLYWAAMTMLGEGADDEDLEALHESAVAVGLPGKEARATILSAVRKVQSA